ncbi:lactosylceramide 1,3-N-acetyl-beta-D-glucosaminyltransferase-like [Biomphalaria glabrata]|uniref:Hexosyltransferase n=1 Tax=Biomphalaria glabrata TaxID=6526 RepID=A0A9W2YD31_BIOGL|nr:lactosylceramide 1,3-N-acetyl-beta-D-glucosaminyltransferase-like [Biomphalaria glabrata]
MAPSKVRRLLTTVMCVMCVSLLVNVVLWFKGQGRTMAVSVMDEDDETRLRSKEVVLKLADDVGLFSIRPGKEALLTCSLDQDTKDIPSKALSCFSMLAYPVPRTTQLLIAHLESQIATKNYVISFLSQPIRNRFSFTYTNVIQNGCWERNPEVLLVIPSAPENFERRELVRKSERGVYASRPDSNVNLVFFVGRPENNTLLQQRLTIESYVHGDIVQVNFVDVYRNILLKAVSMLHWSLTHCPKARYVLRTDDDVLVDIQKVVQAIRRKRELHENFILGKTDVKFNVVRNKSSKYYVSPKEFDQEVYPPFAFGGLLAYPMSTVSLLYQAALRLKTLWLDDVFITGICAPRVGVPLVDDPDFEFEHPEE